MDEPTNRPPLFIRGTSVPIEELHPELFPKSGRFGFLEESTATEIRLLRETIERCMTPWYVRLWRLFERNKALKLKKQIDAAQEKAETARREHMQRLAENAHLMTGRFRSRYG